MPFSFSSPPVAAAPPAAPLRGEGKGSRSSFFSGSPTSLFSFSSSPARQPEQSSRRSILLGERRDLIGPFFAFLDVLVYGFASLRDLELGLWIPSFGDEILWF